MLKPNFQRPAIGCTLLMAMFLPVLAHAQIHKPYVPPTLPKDTSKFLIFEDVTAGPYFTAGDSRQNEKLPSEASGIPWHTASRFSYMFGGTIDFSVNKWIGLDFSGLYDSRDLYLASAGDSDNVDIALGYVEFEPAIRILYLLIGLAFDIPMSGSATENIAAYQHLNASGIPDQPVQKYSANLNVSTSDMGTLTELRGTISVPLLHGDDADLHLIVSGSYPLTKTLATSAPSFDTTSHFSGRYAPGQGPLVTIQAGLSYQFDLLH